MEDNFSGYIAQLKTQYKDTKFKTLFFNGNLIEDVGNSKKLINLYLELPKNPSENFMKALEINLNNPFITTIYLFTNFNNNRIINHKKIIYVDYSKHFGLQMADITSYFKQNEINIFMYYIFILDVDSLTYVDFLKQKQFGVLSSKIFEDNVIPDDVNIFKNLSFYNNINSEFNGFVILGKLKDYDLFLNMYGSINLLLSFLTLEYEIINLSKICISFSVDIKEYSDTYICDDFPLIYAPVQLYFMEDLNISIPPEDEFELFSKEITVCITPEEISTKEDILPISDQYEITEIKNKILSQFIKKYRVEYSKKLENFEENCKTKFNLKEQEINLLLQQYKSDKLTELNLYSESEKTKLQKRLEEYKEEENVKTLQKIQENERLLINELETRRQTEHKKINIEIQSKLDFELQRVNKITEDTENRANIAFKKEIELYTQTAYNNLDTEIKEYKQSKLKEIDQQNTLFNKEELFRINKEHCQEKERLDKLLHEYENYKKQEFDSLYQTEYLKNYSKILLEIETELETLKAEKLKELQGEISKKKEDLLNEMKLSEKNKLRQIETKIKQYENELMEKVDLNIKQIIQQKLQTEETKMQTELNSIKSNKIKQIEINETARIQKECEIIKQGIQEQIDIELALFKTKEYDSIKLDIDRKISLIYGEEIEKQNISLLNRESELKLKQDIDIENIKNIKLKEFDEFINNKISERNVELQDYKTKQLYDLKLFLDQYKENELTKFELTKKLMNDNLGEEIKLKQKDLLTEISNLKQIQINEIKSEINEEKTKINLELEERYKEKLEGKNKLLEDEYSAKLQENFHKLEKENELLITNLIKSSKKQYDDYLENIDKEKNELEKTIIENHNKQLKELDEEYKTKLDFHKSVIKDSIKEERGKLLLEQSKLIESELHEYKKQRFIELEKDIQKDVNKRQEDLLEKIDVETNKIKEEKLESINLELLEYKRVQEEKLRNKFRSLYTDLKEFQ
jgi:hypothetical protein